MGKYPKFKVIDPYNTQMKKKKNKPENFFKISKYEHGVAHFRPHSDTLSAYPSHIS